MDFVSLSEFYNKPGKLNISSELSGEQVSKSANFECQHAQYKANWDTQKLPCAFLIAFRQDIQYLSQLGGVPADGSVDDTWHRWWY